MKHSKYIIISIVGGVLFFVSMNFYMFTNDEEFHWGLLAIGFVSFILIVIGERGRKGEIKGYNKR